MGDEAPVMYFNFRSSDIRSFHIFYIVENEVMLA